MLQLQHHYNHKGYIMDHIIQEIDDDLKRERLQNLWRSFGSHIVALSVVVLVGTAGLVGWKEYRDARNQSATDTLVSVRELIETKKSDKAREKLEAALPDMHGALKLIGQLWLGQIYQNEQKLDKADALFAEVRSQKDEPELAAYADLLHSKTSDEFKNSSMFTALSKEKQGVALLKSGDRMGAAAIFKALEEDATTPETMRTRINLLLLTLETETSKLVRTPIATEKTDTTPKAPTKP
jgi:hypothetical protein